MPKSNKSDTYRYRFTGLDPEDFPAPPIARTLEPGDTLELDEPVEHSRLKLTSQPESADQPAEQADSKKEA